MGQCLGRGISNPTPRFRSRMNPELALSLWCSLLDGGCSREGRSGSDGRQDHTGQEGSHRQCQRWSGTSCSLLNVVCRSPPCPQQFAASAQLLPPPLAGPIPRLALDQTPKDRCYCSLEHHHHPHREKVFKCMTGYLNDDITLLSSPLKSLQDIGLT